MNSCNFCNPSIHCYHCLNGIVSDNFYKDSCFPFCNHCAQHCAFCACRHCDPGQWDWSNWVDNDTSGSGGGGGDGGGGSGGLTSGPGVGQEGHVDQDGWTQVETGESAFFVKFF